MTRKVTSLDPIEAMQRRLSSIDIGKTVGRVDPSSYVDPQGFVLHRDNQIFRAIYNDSADFYRGLIEDGTAQRLHQDYGLVRTDISDLSLAEKGCDLVLVHEAIEPATYCVEWCPSMLRDVARLHLELSLELPSQSMMLQDAYPWNVRLQGTRPIFIDFTSIVPADERLLWPAYNQFQSFFLRPLELATLKKGRVARALLYDNINGISIDDFARNVDSSFRLRHPGLSLAQLIDRILQRNTLFKRSIKRVTDKHAVNIDPAVRKKFFRGLLNQLERMRFTESRDLWQNYYAHINPSVDKSKKLSIVGQLLRRIEPPSVVDLGCNTGVFSVLAAECGAEVYSLDASESCMEVLYSYAKSANVNIQPLVVDVLCPTPAFGFLGTQYPPLFERLRSHTVLCLGLMHHLYITGRQSFDRIAHMLKQLATNCVIFEYVDLSDSNIDLIQTTRPIEYSLDTVKQALGRYFNSLEIYESDRPTRKIVLCRNE